MTWHNLRQQNEKPRGQPEPVPRRLRGAEGLRRGRLPRRLRGHGRRGASRRSSPSSRRSTTTSPRSCSRRSPTGWPRPSPSTCTTACAPSTGATRRARALANEDLIAEKYAGIRPAPGYPACPDHTEKGDLFRLLDAQRNAGIDAHRVLRDDAHRGGERLLLLAPRSRATSRSARSSATRSPTTRTARAWTSRPASAGSRPSSTTDPGHADPASVHAP